MIMQEKIDRVDLKNILSHTELSKDYFLWQ